MNNSENTVNRNESVHLRGHCHLATVTPQITEHQTATITHSTITFGFTKIVIKYNSTYVIYLLRTIFVKHLIFDKKVVGM